MHERHILDWLTAERAGREEDAEQMLGAIFRTLPEAMVPAGFADRILVGAGLVLSWPLRAAIGGSLMAAGLAAAFVLPAVMSLLGQIHLGDVLGMAAGTFVGAVNTVDEMVAVWRFLALLRESLWLVATTPTVAFALLATVAVAALALRGLSELHNPQRSPGYV